MSVELNQGIAVRVVGDDEFGYTVQYTNNPSLFDIIIGRIFGFTWFDKGEPFKSLELAISRADDWYGYLIRDAEHSKEIRKDKARRRLALKKIHWKKP